MHLDKLERFNMLLRLVLCRQLHTGPRTSKARLEDMAVEPGWVQCLPWEALSCSSTCGMRTRLGSDLSLHKFTMMILWAYD
mmetsp:Transcript_78564/g.139387  ORF Transcript_78564/g.139387 Transcript_78564/m.139387 type:complete len:81 (-) Transcript_78564:143-385(-)